MFKKLLLWFASLTPIGTQLDALKILIKSFDEAYADKKLTLTEATDLLLQVIHILRSIFPELRK